MISIRCSCEFRDIFKGTLLKMPQLTKASPIECGTEDSKKASKPAEESKSSDACLLCDMGFKISVGDFSGKNKYISTENLFKIPQSGVNKIHLAGLESTSWCLSGSTRWKVLMMILF